MIGAPSFILESCVVLFLVMMLAASLYYAIAKKQRGTFVVAAGVLVMLSLMGTRYWFLVSNHRLLARLHPNDVSAVLIRGRTVTNRSDVEHIVLALNARQWFSSNHGGWSQPVWMNLIRADGVTNQFLVGHYARQEGAVILFGRSTRYGRWSDGYAFSETLPGALKEAGINLTSPPAK